MEAVIAIAAISASVWIPAVTAIVAAGLGSFLTFELLQSRPRVTPTSLTLSVGIIPQGSVVDANSELLAQLRDHPYLKGPPFVGAGRVDEGNYVGYLTRTLTLVRSYLRVQLPGVTDRAQQLQQKLAADDYDGVARIWSGDPKLWEWVEGPYVREEFVFEDPANATDDAQGTKAGNDQQSAPAGADGGGAKTANDAQDTRAADDEEASKYEGKLFRAWKHGDSYYVAGRQQPYYQLELTPDLQRTGPQRDRSDEIGRRLSQAFARSKKDDLIRVFNFLASSTQRRIPELESLEKKIEAELQKLTRLSVTALISNRGGTPVSISTICTNTLHLGGYSYEADGKTRIQTGAYEFKMILVDESGARIPPVAIAPNGVQAVTAVYRTTLSKEPLLSGGTLYDLVRAAAEGSERTWQLAIDAVNPSNPISPMRLLARNRKPFHVIRSRKTPIRIRGLDEPGSDSPLSDGPEAEAEAQVGEHKRRIASLKHELAATRAELSEQKKTNASLQQAHASLETELHAIHAELSQVRQERQARRPDDPTTRR